MIVASVHPEDVFRTAAVVVLAVVMAASWWRGERALRRLDARLPGVQQRVVDTFVGLWRLLMLAATAVAVVTVAGLWWAQDAADTAAAASAAAQQANYELCVESAVWQRSAVNAAETTANIVARELRNAETELADAETVLADTVALVADRHPDGSPPTDAEAFFLRSFQRDVDRAKATVDELTAELTDRRAVVARLETASLNECPPIPTGE